MALLLVGGIVVWLGCSATTPLWVAGLAFLLLNAGVALASIPLATHAVGKLQGAELSHGNAIISSMRLLFGTLGASALVAVTAALSGSETTAQGINAAYGIQVAVFIVGLVLAFFVAPPTAQDRH
jgi:hypothetical protein